jgi:5-methylcytosine-specific restriction enzyme A
MPNAPLRPCLASGCPTLVHSGRCDKHGGQRQPWQPNPHVVQRLRGRANQRRREALFQREPLCRACAKQGRVTVATIRDHITPLAEGGQEGTIENEQPLCQTCSDIKTKQEAQRGQGRRAS